MKAICGLTQEVKSTSSQHCDQVSHLAIKHEGQPAASSHLLATNKKQDEAENDQLTKAIKLMISIELQRVESTFVAEVRFMVDQLQLEV